MIEEKFNPVPKPQPKKKRNKSAEHKRACAKYLREFAKDNGYYFCELCGDRKPKEPFSVHHIMSTGQYGGHPEIDNKRNLVLVCGYCHRGLHLQIKGKEDIFRAKKEKLIIDRGLRKLFGVENG